MTSNRIKILVINTSFRCEGPNEVLWNVARHVDTSRFELVFACMHEGGPMEGKYRDAGFVTHNFEMERFTDLGAIFRVRNFILAGKFDLVMVQLLRAEVFGGCGTWLSGVPLVLVVHNTDPYRANPRLVPEYFLSRMTLCWPEKFIAVSDFVRSYVIAHQKVSEDKIRTIRCTVDTDHFRALATEYESARSEFHFGTDTLVIGTIARLAPQKGLIYLLNAFKALYPSYPHLRLLIVGDGTLRSELEHWVQRENLCERIIFTGFRLDRDKLLQGFDIFALPSLWEGLPIVLLEAMASAKPIVTTRVSGIPEVIEHDINGLMASSGDVADFTGLLKQLLTDKSKMSRLGARAREYVEIHCSAKEMTKQYEKVWLETLGL